MNRTSDFLALAATAANSTRPRGRSHGEVNPSLHREYDSFIQAAFTIQDQINAASQKILRLESLDNTTSPFHNMDDQVDRTIQEIQVDIQAISRTIETLAAAKLSSSFNAYFKVSLSFFPQYVNYFNFIGYRPL